MHTFLVHHDGMVESSSGNTLASFDTSPRNNSLKMEQIWLEWRCIMTAQQPIRIGLSCCSILTQSVAGWLGSMRIFLSACRKVLDVIVELTRIRFAGRSVVGWRGNARNSMRRHELVHGAAETP
jgi:hypothetical protein